MQVIIVSTQLAPLPQKKKNNRGFVNFAEGERLEELFIYIFYLFTLFYS